MGQEIVYCYKCQKRILGAEFGKGRAYQVGHHVSCADCAPALLETLGTAERAELLGQMYKSLHGRASSLEISSSRPPQHASAPLSSSSTRLKSGHGADRRKTTAHIPIVRPAPTDSGTSPRAIYGAVAGVACLLIAFFWAASSGGSRPREERRDPPRPDPPPAVALSPEPPRVSPEETRELARARAGLEQARAFESAHPRDFEALITHWEEAAKAAESTPFLREARRELDRVAAARREAAQNDLPSLEAKTGASLRAEEFKAAVDLFQASRARYDLPEWTSAIDRRSRQIYDMAAQLYPPVQASAVAARKAGRSADVEAARSRVRKWNFPEFMADLESALSAATPEPPAIPPKPRSKEVETYESRWQEAFGKASLRDYAGATEVLRRASEPLSEPEVRADAAGDLEGVRAAQSVLQEALEVLSRSARGQKLSLARWNGSGGLERVEGTVLASEGTRLLLKREELTESLELGEVTPASLAELFSSRAQKNPANDPRSEAFFCLLEGDPETARALAKGVVAAIPEKYWSAGEKLAQSRRKGEIAENESAARNLFYRAEAGLADYSKTAETIGSYKALLADYPRTAFVNRNRASIAKRLGEGREFVFFPDGMKASGSFQLAKAGKLDTCWSSVRDSDPAKQPENYVELVFSSLADLDYRCWIYAGACCLETFQSSVQASGLKVASPKNPKETVSAEPGSAFALILKPTVYLKKTHAMHGGPKTPARWEWISIPLPKDPAPGIRNVRILTDQKGFSVGAAIVSANRTGPPTESELKEFERLRGRFSPPSTHDPSLLACWKLDEGEGAIASDSSGSGLAGSLRNSPAWSSGEGARALSFNGINQYVDLGTPPKLNVAGPFTVSARVNPGALGSQPRYIFADYLERGDCSAFALRFEASGQASFFWEYPGGVEPKATSKARCAAGAWVHLTGVWDGSTRKIYVNGVFEGSDATPQQRPPGISSLAIGRPGAYNGFYASGLIRDVRFYARILSDIEIAALAKGVQKPPAPAPAPTPPSSEGWVNLQDSPNLAGWETVSGQPRLEGGVLTLGGEAEVQRAIGADFELEGSIQVIPSGIDGGSISFRRSGKRREPPMVTFYGDGDVHGEDRPGSQVMAGSGALPTRMWHRFQLRVVGGEATFTSEGKQILRAPVTRREAGNLALYNQEPRSAIQFKDLRIREFR